ncbi:MAG: hypothetical protein IPL96_06380 [Holophagaceae bacterium]|nr:hypothetical protein [Holophagaceae bacterium]
MHFYGHEALSVELADQVLARLKASTQVREHAKALITLHGEYPTKNWSDAAFRRLLVRLDQAGVSVSEWELFRLADQYGKGWYEVGHPDGRSGEEWWNDTRQEWNEVAQRLERVRFPGMTVKGLAIDSLALMDLAGRPGGPWLGRLQKHLLEAVLEDPGLNTDAALRDLAARWLASEG